MKGCTDCEIKQRIGSCASGWEGLNKYKWHPFVCRAYQEEIQGNGNPVRIGRKLKVMFNAQDEGYLITWKEKTLQINRDFERR